MRRRRFLQGLAAASAVPFVPPNMMPVTAHAAAAAPPATSVWAYSVGGKIKYIFGADDKTAQVILSRMKVEGAKLGTGQGGAMLSSKALAHRAAMHGAVPKVMAKKLSSAGLKPETPSMSEFEDVLDDGEPQENCHAATQVS